MADDGFQGKIIKTVKADALYEPDFTILHPF